MNLADVLYPIPRERGLAHTRHCREEPDGGITLQVGLWRKEIAPDEICDQASFAETFNRLTDIQWFTPSVALEFVAVVAARWLGQARHWS